MADFEFTIKAGPYAGEYRINQSELSASVVGDLIAQGGPDLDAVLSGQQARGVRAVAGLVWVVRHEGNRGLAYRAVADAINWDVFEPGVKEEAAEPVLPGPSSSGVDSGG